jgi:twitching motility protein PilT
VLRVIPQVIPSASDLNLPAALLEMCRHSKGLVLVTGPTGSGKSTTLAAMIDHINDTRREHIITVEDPIEFVHQNKKCLLNQREVHRHTGSFARALRAALREDPDIVLVGEMRDLETVKIAIETAETGHLVFGTLHTSSAVSTVDRIIDQFPADQQSQVRMMLSNSLKGVISQTLCRKIGGGRVAAQEILVVNNAVASLVREGKTHQILSSMQIGAKEGMRLLNDVLFDHVTNGRITPMEAFMKCVAKDDMRTKLESGGYKIDAVQAAAPKLPSQHAPSAPPPMPRNPSTASAPPSAAPPAATAATPQPAAAPSGGGDPGYVDPFEEFRKKRGGK